MATTKRLRKIAITDNIYARLEKAKSIVVTDYRGMTTSQLLELRQKLGQSQSEYTITKNTLLYRALKRRGFAVADDVVSGPSAILVTYEDEIAPIKTLAAFAKTTQLPRIKGGYLGQDYITKTQVDSLALLPSRQVLLGQVVSTMNVPIYGFVSVLQGTIRNFVYVLQAVKDKQASL